MDDDQEHELDDVDFNELYDLLLDATRNAFRFVKEAHPDETFYAFGLYYDIEDAIDPFSHSEEAHLRLNHLTQCDRDNQTLEWFCERWTVTPWEYYAAGSHYFEEVSDWMDRNLSPLRDYVDFEDEEALRVTLDECVGWVCENVLKALEREGLFGSGEARETIFLDVIGFAWDYGADVRDLSRGYCLNPPSTYQRHAFEEEMQSAAIRFLSPSRFDPNPE